MSTQSVNKRIAKNTVYLYLRMLISILVQFYTARVVLKTLGVEDYGIYNVVGGVIVLFAFLNNAMSSSTQRFLSFEIGRGDLGNIREAFNTSMYCHAIIAVLLILLSETIGLWFFKEKLVIPEDRQLAAMWVYQISVLNTVVNILRVPLNASIISYEKMSFYAYVSIFEVALKLGVVFLLVVSPIDKLITYALLLLLVSVLLYFIHWIYCFKQFPECRVRRGFNHQEGKKMLVFSSWKMLSGATTVANQQGGNMMLNIFFGVAYNAAYGIANQASSAIYMFVTNFQMAFEPQIVKQFAAKEFESLTKLVFRASALSYYLLLLISIPFVTEVDWVMAFWLGNAPEYAGVFCVLLVAYFLVDAIQAPLWMVIGASGDIKEYTIWSSGVALLNLPIVYLILKNDGSVLWVFGIRVILNLLIACIRIPYVKRFINYSCKQYFTELIIPTVVTTLIAAITSYLIKKLALMPLLTILLSIVSTLLIILFIGLKKDDRNLLFQMLKAKIQVHD